MSLADTLNKQMYGDMSTGHFIGMVLACCAALVIMCVMGNNIIGWLLAAAIAYLLAHLFHNSHKQKAILGAVAVVFIILIGGLSVGPSMMDGYKSDADISSKYFKHVSMTYDEGTGDFTVTATIENDTEYTPVISYSGVSMLVFGGLYANETLSAMEKSDFASGSHTYSGWNTNNLHYIALSLAKDNGDGSYTVEAGTSVGFTDASVFTGDASGLYWAGSAYAAAFFAAIFYFITFCSWFFRRRMSRTRKKMEEQGRLYPQGYGRCEKCGAIVLPGEVECRKCGTYIERPDSMKPKKVNYIRCTNCGCEVSDKDTVCPKCGATFVDEETEVIHADGSVAFVCPECGSEVPEGADGVRICPRCGKRFQD